MNPEILRYITANRNTYTREAITRQLIEAGHNPAEIQRTWESIEVQRIDRLTRDRTFWRYFTLGVAVVYGLTFLVYALRLRDEALGDEAFANIWSTIFGVCLLLGAWTSILVVRSSTMVATAVAKGAVSGLLIAVLIVFVPLVIIAGLCSVLLATF